MAEQDGLLQGILDSIISLNGGTAGLEAGIAAFRELQRNNQMLRLALKQTLELCNQPSYSGQGNVMALSELMKPTPMKPTEEELVLLAKLRTASIAEKKEKIDKKCTLHIFPPEVRDQIFDLILVNYFAQYPRLKVLDYQNWTRGQWDRIDTPGNAGLPLKDLPAFEIALIPDQKLYRHFFALRIKQCIIELRPSLTWNHMYDFPLGYEVADPPKEIMGWLTDESKYKEDYWQWVYNQDMQLGIRSLECLNPRYLRRGWIYQYPSLSMFSPLMLDSIRSVEIVLSTDYLNTQYLDVIESIAQRHAPIFDIPSCHLPHAKLLTHLSYRLNSHTWWHSTPSTNSNSNSPTSSTLPTSSTSTPPILLQSLQTFLSPFSTTNSPIPNPIPIPTTNPQIQTLTIKTLTPKPHPGLRNPVPQQTLNSISPTINLLNKMFHLQAESTWTREEVAPGAYGILRGWKTDCYQLVWEAPVGGRLMVCMEEEETEGAVLEG
ncbi:hypothetical protein SBOR_1257 [Sclerotinia borealis F-4128]|uniref:Uncharacterized protein n=1 Tax=Sclerotinia borealis (strain F-4128) TaxID=1432307 RepID=W9CUW7_SCLBF|nr:hypothetical protein SBOR_1257 [Sclerotinia borealis F-4128]